MSDRITASKLTAIALRVRMHREQLKYIREDVGNELGRDDRAFALVSEAHSVACDLYNYLESRGAFREFPKAEAGR